MPDGQSQDLKWDTHLQELPVSVKRSNRSAKEEEIIDIDVTQEPGNHADSASAEALAYSEEDEPVERDEWVRSYASLTFYLISIWNWSAIAVGPCQIWSRPAEPYFRIYSKLNFDQICFASSNIKSAADISQLVTAPPQSILCLSACWEHKRTQIGLLSENYWQLPESYI